MRLLFAALLVAVLLGCAMLWSLGSLMVAGQRSRVAPAVFPAQDLLLETQDGLRIAATYTPGRRDGAPAVLLLHGVGASRQALAANAAWLAGLGYATLTVDFRGHGQSDLATRTFGLHEAREARTAFTWLKARQGGAPVGVIGISLGGAASLLGDDGPLPADALILQAVYPDIRHAIRNRLSSRLGSFLGAVAEPFLSFQSLLRFGVWPERLSPLEALRRYDGPVLVIGGTEDHATPPAETRAMAEAVRGRHELWLVPHGDHPEICGLEDQPYRNMVASFLSVAMPP